VAFHFEKDMSSVISGAAFVGLMVSFYALYIELEMERAARTGIEFKAACDIGKGMSCSAVLSSKYGKVLSLWGLVPHHHWLDVPNALVGGIYFLIALVYPLYKHVPAMRSLFMGVSCVAIAFCAYLAYVLRYVLHDFCLVCVSSYVINLIIFLAALREMTARPARREKARAATKLD